MHWLVPSIFFLLLLLMPYSSSRVDAARPDIKDSSLQIDIFTKGLHFPTGMVFLNSNELLVTEKDEGKVVHVVDGTISDKAVLTIDRNEIGERGLLGIAVPRDFQTNEKDKVNVTKYVFLFYTEAKDGHSYDGPTNYNVTCNQNKCEFNNRLYRYEYTNNTLINPKLLIDIPLYWDNRIYPSTLSKILHGGTDWRHYELREGIHNGGTLVMDYDNNVYVSTGDGGGCHKYDTCSKSIANGYLSVQSANKRGGNPSVGMSGILRATQDGEPVGNKGILGDERPLSLYYAYGIRNSFGIDFDPVTKDLWDTENGPHFGDEINLVKPGFNSGWAKIQGIWPIIDYKDIHFNATEKGYSRAPAMPVYDDFEDFNGKGKYSDPEFTWNESTGASSVKFLNTDKLGKQYENDLFVGDSYGNIYNFDLNENRTALDLNGALTDKVANSENELKNLIFASGLDTITDMEVGPDGLLYVLSYSGNIFKIGPKVDNG